QVLVHRFLSEVPQSSASGSPTPGSPQFHRFCPLHSPGNDRCCRTLRFQIPSQLPFSLLSSFVLLLQPFAPRALPRFLATTASDDFWASLLPASLPPAPCLTAGSCSYGREFATRFFQLHLAAMPCVSLRLPSSAPVGSFHPTRFCPCWAHWRRRSSP